jgi:hypothetical protein
MPRSTNVAGLSAGDGWFYMGRSAHFSTSIDPLSNP